MKAKEVPKKIYINSMNKTLIDMLSVKVNNDYIEYIRTDAFDALIDNAAEFLHNYNQKQVLKHGAKATLSCNEYTINVDEFRKYMKEKQIE